MDLSIAEIMNKLGIEKVKKINTDMDYIGEKLSKWIGLCYEVETAYAHAMSNNLAWPGEKNWSKVMEVEEIENSIRAKLDLNYKQDKKFLEEINAFKNEDNKGLKWEEHKSKLSKAFDEYKKFRISTKMIFFR